MGAVWMRAKNDLRARWRGALVLAVVIGVAGGIVMTAAAGARRTRSSYERLLERSRAYEIEVQNVGDDDPAILDTVGKLPQVDEYTRVTFVPAMKTTPGSPPGPFSWDVSALAMVDPNLGRTIEIPRIVDGRLPNVEASLEAVVNERFAEVRGVGVGSEFSMQLVTLDELLELFGGRAPTPTGPMVTLRIVGIWRVPHDVSIGEREGFIFLTPAFFSEYRERTATLWGMFVRLKNADTDTAAFLAAAREIGDEDSLSFQTRDELVAKVDRALGIQTSALWILGLVVAVGGGIILGQALGRWIGIGAAEHPTLRALGMSPAGRAGAAAFPAVMVGLGAVAVATATAILGSFLVPVGFARGIEPDIGIFVDGPVLALGGAAVLLFVALRGGISGLLLARRRTGHVTPTPAQPSTVADRLARGGFPPTVVNGVRFALESGRGRSAVPVRSVLVGTTLSIVAVVGAFLFGRSMDQMTTTPATYGFNWDLVGFGGEDLEIVDEVERKLATTKEVAAFSRVHIKAITFGDSEIDTLGVTPIEGSVLPTLLEGRYPAADDEVALGTKTMRVAELAVGDRANFPGSAEACGGKDKEGCTLSFRVVGRIVFWAEDADPDDGAAFTGAGQDRLRGTSGFQDFLVRIPRGEDPKAALRSIEQAIGGDATVATIPTSIQNLARVRSMPSLLAAILAALALATLVHALITCVRRRATDLAILKTLGLVRRQVIATVLWQATTLMVLSLIVGVPLGVLAGRQSWSFLADRIGVQSLHAMPLAAMALGSLSVILLANLVAALPGRAAARVQPAVVLRSE
jgi:hypothetical protein